MQLWVGDYLGDTRHLTTEQHGAYLLLLMSMWRLGGSVPADDDKLARLSGLTLTRWNRIKGDVMALLVIENGEVTQKRLKAEYKKAEEKSSKNSHAGKIGVQAKALKNNNQAQANAQPTLKQSEPESYSKKKEERAAPTAQPPKPARKSATSIPDNFPDQAAQAMALGYWADRDRMDLLVADEAEIFRAHHMAHGKRMADWGQAWVTWYSNAIKFNRKPDNGRVSRKSNHETFFDAASAVAARIQAGPSEEARSPHEATIILLPGRADKIAN